MTIAVVLLSVAILAGVGLILHVAGFSLLTGAFYFIFGGARLEILKTKHSENGFAFGLNWNKAREAVKFNKVQIRLFNPFGTPTQVEATKEFDAADDVFARDLEMGPSFYNIISAQGFEDALIQIEFSSKEGISEFFEMKGREFRSKIQNASLDVESYESKYKVTPSKPFFHTNQKSFIAEPLPSTSKTLKIATNPEYAGEFAAAAGAAAGGAAVENFKVNKVWIVDGCIVCDACESIFPEVFDVQEAGTVIRPNAPLDDGLKIEEAAEACPVEVIKFDKAN